MTQHLTQYLRDEIDSDFIKFWGLDQKIPQKGLDLYEILNHPEALYQDYENAVDPEDMDEYILDRIVSRFIGTPNEVGDAFTYLEQIQREKLYLAYLNDGGCRKWLPDDYEASLFGLKWKLSDIKKEQDDRFEEETGVEAPDKS